MYVLIAHSEVKAKNRQACRCTNASFHFLYLGEGISLSQGYLIYMHVNRMNVQLYFFAKEKGISASVYLYKGEGLYITCLQKPSVLLSEVNARNVYYTIRIRMILMFVVCVPEWCSIKKKVHSGWYFFA